MSGEAVTLVTHKDKRRAKDGLLVPRCILLGAIFYLSEVELLFLVEVQATRPAYSFGVGQAKRTAALRALATT